MTYDPAPYELRRKSFSEEVGDGLAVLPAGGPVARNFDVDYPFRQESDFFFLTGFPEPDAVAVINPSHPSERYVLFVQPRDRQAEMWDGPRAGVEGAVETYGADAAYPIDELDGKLREYFIGRPALHYRLGNRRFDSRIVGVMRAASSHRTRTGSVVPTRIEDPSAALHEMRVLKTAPEVERLRRACQISAEAHNEAMRYAAPEMFEYQVQAALEYVFRIKGSPRDGYPSIVASGPNACILHYVESRRQMHDGELLLIDAGCEYGHFSADITRTFPVGGTYTAPQRAVYELVLAAQEAVIGECRPGTPTTRLHDVAVRSVTEGLVELGLLPLSVDDSVHMGHYRQFFMHGTSHWLGMDVHDAGRYRIGGEGRPLEPGMTFTVEPGVYLDPERERVLLKLRPYDDDASRELTYRLGAAAARQKTEEEEAEVETLEHPIPAEFRGIGVRIEDDILITESGFENLSGDAPRHIADVEAMCAEPSSLPPP